MVRKRITSRTCGEMDLLVSSSCRTFIFFATNALIVIIGVKLEMQIYTICNPIKAPFFISKASVGFSITG